MTGDRGVDTPMNVTIRYELRREEGRVRAVRDGEVEVFPARLRAQQWPPAQRPLHGHPQHAAAAI